MYSVGRHKKYLFHLLNAALNSDLLLLVELLELKEQETLLSTSIVLIIILKYAPNRIL